MSAAMRVRLFSGGRETFVSPFIAKFTSGVCCAVVSALKAPPARDRLAFEVAPESVAVLVDGAPVDLDSSQGFAATIVRDTLLGMVQSLKGIDARAPVRIEV